MTTGSASIAMSGSTSGASGRLRTSRAVLSEIIGYLSSSCSYHVVRHPPAGRAGNAANAIAPTAAVSGAGKPAPSAVDQLRLRTDVPLSTERDWYQIGANRTLGSGIRDGQAAHADHPVMAQYRQIPDGPGYRAERWLRVIHSGRKGPRQLLDRKVEHGPTMWN